MLIATRDMKCFDKKVLAGQPIPSPKKWHPSSLQSCINLGWVREATPEEEKVIRDVLSAEETAQVAEATFAPPIDPKPPGKPEEQIPCTDKAPAPKPVEPLQTPAGFEYVCGECKRFFKSAQALSSHARSHRPKP